MYKNILIATDGSDLATRAAKYGVNLAKSVGAKIIAVNVSKPYHWFDPDMLPEAQVEYTEGAKRAAAAVLGAIADTAKTAGVACQTIHVEEEQPYKAIVDAARSKDCDLIVMASHGRSGVSAVVLGSETVKVLTHSKIPVLVLR